MKVKNKYNECLTNFACSIRKYFELDYSHNTLEYIDKILEERNPQNVVTILLDGMGSNIIDKILPKDSIFIQNRIKPITSVFPATTVAATTSVLTGLNPIETGMLGWNMYYKDIDKIITTYWNCEKEDELSVPLEEAKEYKKKNMITKTIMDEINEVGKYTGYTLYPFGENAYKDIDDMLQKIEEISNKKGKKYIYAYDEDPDKTMHVLGTDSEETKNIIYNRCNEIEKLSKKLKDTVIFVIADHGHINVENIFLKDYPKIVECLCRNTSIEPRAINFFIKENKKEEFIKLFNKEFSNYFDLYTKDEIIESKIFGDGKENKIFRDSLGDFLAIAKENKALLFTGDHEFKSQHAGYTEDEILVPLIVI